EFYNGATKLGEDLTSPYTYSWSGVSAGNYQLTARAIDNAGTSATSAVVNITVNNPANTAPTVTITSPANNTTYTAPASITIVANASDTDGTVSQVEFFQGTNKLGEVTSSPYSFTWNSVAAGTYALTARATDNLGAASTSAVVNVTVNAPANQGPTVSITSPSNNATFTAPATISIGATASDPDGSVVKVEFFQGTTKLGEDLTSPYSISWESVQAGSYSLTARVTDNLGAVATSEAVNVTVSAPASPSITGFNPTSGAVGTEVTITGTNLSRATSVTFGPSSAQITANSASQVKALVPAVNGKLPRGFNISVSTAGGSVTAKDKFTITPGVAANSTSALQSAEWIEGGVGLVVYPNPFSDKVTVSFALSKEGSYTLSLYDEKGMLIALLKEGKSKANQNHTLEIDGSKLAVGVYFIRLEREG
ncbi:MAG: Ig-like domain-containing protein, partial [Pontibacter sp.]|nr:Ig-like domain-containing protein [Pontibacter sp.]